MKNDQKEACHCRNITYGRIRKAISQGARSFEEVCAATGLGSGCGKCREFAEYLVKDMLREMNETQ